MCDAYFDKGSEPISGLYFFHKPVLMIRERELIKRILVKDFNYFTNRFVINIYFGIIISIFYY